MNFTELVAYGHFARAFMSAMVIYDQDEPLGLKHGQDMSLNVLHELDVVRTFC